MRKIYNLINHFENGGKPDKFSPNKTGSHNITKIWLIKSFSNFLKQNDILIFLDRFFYYFYTPVSSRAILCDWEWWAGGRPHRFPHNNFSSVYQIFTKLGHMIPLWKRKNTIYFGVIRSKVKYNFLPFDNLYRLAYFVMHTFLVFFLGSFGHVHGYIMWTVTNYSFDWGPLCCHEYLLSTGQRMKQIGRDYNFDNSMQVVDK